MEISCFLRTVSDTSTLSVDTELVDEKTLTESVLLIHKVCCRHDFIFLSHLQ